MKKIILTFVLLLSVIEGVLAQNNAVYVYTSDGTVDVVRREEINSIDYSKNDVDGTPFNVWKTQKINVGDLVLTHNLCEIDSVVIAKQSAQVFDVVVDGMTDWDNCYMLSNASGNYFMCVKKIPETGDTYVRFGEYEKQDNCTDFYLDSDNNIYSIVKNDCLYFASKSDDQYSFTKMSNEGKITDVFSVTVSSATQSKGKAASNVANLGMDIYSLLSGHNDFQNKNYSELSLSVIENMIVTGAKLPGWTNFFAQVGMEVAKHTLIKSALNEYYQGCTPQIVEISNGKIKVFLPNVEKINQNYGIYLTVAVKKGSDDVSYTNNDMLLPKVFLSSSSYVSIDMPDLGVGTYHMVPVLFSNYIKTEHPILKNSLTSTGKQFVFKKPNVKVETFTHQSCELIQDTYYLTASVSLKMDDSNRVEYCGVDVLEKIGTGYELIESYTNVNTGSEDYNITLKLKLNKESSCIKDKCIYLSPYAFGDNSRVYGDIEKEDIQLMFSCPDNNHPHAIDLGLPSGTKWCCMNVGASSPEGYGGYYAWGETNEKSVYDWDTYAYGSDLYNVQNIGSDIAGTSYDVAHVRMGGSWRMPSDEQQRELRRYCTSAWTQQNGVNGRLMTGVNGGQIFLPAAGCRYDSSLSYDGSDGYYWSSSLYESNSYYAYGLYFSSSNVFRGYNGRHYGQSVRAVCP